MLVTDDRLVSGRDVVALARAAAAGGASAVQVRLKEATARDQVALARELVAALAIPVLVNDRPDVAIAAGAAGVHLGTDDLPVGLARRIAPPGFVIGASVGSEAEAAAAGDADYWGVGPWRITRTKAGAGIALGPEGLGRIVRLARGKPCVAIGAVRPEDAALVRGAGGSGMAVASGILGGDDIQAATAAYAEAWRRGVSG